MLIIYFHCVPVTLKYEMPNSKTNNSTLPDYLVKDLSCLSVGLNPSIPSIEKGFYFANPRNRFWPAFNQALVVGQKVTPAQEAHVSLLKVHGLGFTDVVKRPSRMGKELRASDFKRDAPVLRNKIEKFKPRLIWIHGKVAIQQFLKYGYGITTKIGWGINQFAQIDPPVFLTPNPSPANAAYSLDDLVTYYRQLAKLL